MTILQSLLLWILQGLTEFLPVSSSGHLVLAEKLFKITLDENVMLSFDVILHAGTLLALLLYFSKTWKTLIKTFFCFFSNNTQKEDKDFLKTLILATIPIIIAWLLLKDVIEEYFRDPKYIFVFMGIIWVVMFFAEKIRKFSPDKKIWIKEGIIVWLFQCIALLPWVSRSGTTISTAMFQGVKRDKAAEFSFLLWTVALTAATCYIGLKIFMSWNFLPINLVATGFIASFVSSLICVHFLLKFLKNHTLIVFSIYLIVISTVGLWIVG